MIFITVFSIVFSNEYLKQKELSSNFMKKLKQKNSELSLLTNTDELTQLCSRRYILRHLASYVKKANKKTDWNFSLMMFDLDNLKAINDTFGHLTGDMIIRKIAKIIKNMVPPECSIGRYGGDEFLILFPDIYKEIAFVICDNLLKQIESQCKKGVVSVTFSGGLVEYQKNATPDEALLAADKLLYQVKTSGKNRILI